MKFFQKNVVFWVALQEALISMAPYVVIQSIVVLTRQLAGYFHFHIGVIDAGSLSILSKTLIQFTAVGMVVSIAYIFSVRYNTDNIVSILLSLAVFASIVALLSDPDKKSQVLPYQIDGFQIFSPIITVLIFAKLSKKFNLSLPTQRGYVFITRIFEQIYSFIVVYFVVMALFLTTYHLFHGVTNALSQIYLTRSTDIRFIIRTLSVQLFWYVGIHGSRITEVLLDTSFLEESFIFPNLRYRDFYMLFTLSGGAGMGLSLLIAIFIRIKNEVSIKIAKLSIPFVLFNINTLIIYGLPVVLNRYLLVPFVLIPLINSGIAYFILSVFPVQFSTTRVTWISPVFLNAYIMTDGNFFVILLQFFLIVLGVLIYLPFLKRYNFSSSIDVHKVELSKNLGIIPTFKSKEGLKSHQKQQDLMVSNYQLSKTIKMLQSKNLTMYYQPKVDIFSGNCDSYEALLRIHTSNGQVKGPFFLEELEKAGLAPVIDLWTSKRIRQDIDFWASHNFFPSISINLHPDTLQDDGAIKQIAKTLKDKNVEFEILERALLGGVRTQKNLAYLKNMNFRLAVDDYGEGYTSHKLFNTGAISTLKMDRSMVNMISKNNGLAICQNTISLCELLNFKCIVEGVETQEQLALLQSIGARFIQGFVFSEALPPEDIQNYTPRMSFKT